MRMVERIGRKRMRDRDVQMVRELLKQMTVWGERLRQKEREREMYTR